MPREAYIADLDGVEKLFKKLFQNFDIYAPVLSEGACKFARVKVFHEVCLECVNTLLPSKKLFMPVQETLFSFNLAAKSVADLRVEVIDVITPAVRNVGCAERVLWSFAPKMVQLDEQRLLAECEKLVRCFDFCISCSVRVEKVGVA